MSTTLEADRIQLLVDGDGNREALAALLEERYTVVTGEGVADADLHVVDDRSLPRYREDLTALKRESGREFRPIVLVHREGTRLDLDLPGETDDPTLVDEVVTAPVEREVFFRRLSNLLVRREQFQELTAKNDRLEEFASFVSHDLRNPLQVAQGHLTMLEGDADHLEAIAASLDRIEEVTEAVLTLARQEVAAEEFTAVRLETTVERVWAETETAGATLVLGDDRPVIADGNQLCRLFSNLFRNAVEHGSTSPDSHTRQDAVEHGSTSPDSHTRQDAVEHGSDPTSPDSHTRQDADEDVTVRVGTLESGFFVEDDGPGIPPERRGDVLEKGFTTDPDGTGLGLNIVSAVVDAHGWEIRVTESDSGGARFEITGVDRTERPDEC